MPRRRETASIINELNVHLSCDKEKDMNKVVVVVFGDEKQAYQGSRALRDLHQEGNITMYSDAVITKDATGKASVRKADDAGPEGTLIGLLVGSFAGLVGGPVGLGVGAGTGTLIGAAFDLTRLGIDSDFVAEVEQFLLPGHAAVVAEIDETWQTPLDTRMEALHGRIFRRSRVDVEDTYYEREIAAFETELASLEAELENASAKRKARLEGKVQETRQKLEAKQQELTARIESVKRENEAKIESLKGQIATVSGEQRERLAKRLDEVRTEYRERTAKLDQAWKLTKAALTP
jgi:uncharacterized membrane protein